MDPSGAIGFPYSRSTTVSWLCRLVCSGFTTVNTHATLAGYGLSRFDMVHSGLSNQGELWSLTGTVSTAQYLGLWASWSDGNSSPWSYLDRKMGVNIEMMLLMDIASATGALVIQVI